MKVTRAVKSMLTHSLIKEERFFWNEFPSLCLHDPQEDPINDLRELLRDAALTYFKAKKKNIEELEIKSED